MAAQQLLRQTLPRWGPHLPAEMCVSICHPDITGGACRGCRQLSLLSGLAHLPPMAPSLAVGLTWAGVPDGSIQSE